mgnify:CR=1 FL=1
MRATTTDTLDEPLPALDDDPPLVREARPDCPACSESLRRWLNWVVFLTLLGDD